jgi:hypothetical protein
MLVFALLLLLHPPALNFFKQYWNQRLSYAIMGGRSESVRHGLGRLYVLWILLRENSILLGLTCVGILFSLIRRIPVTSPTPEKKWALVFLGLALAGTVPLMLSTRQAAMYLIPSLVMFAIAAALFHYDVITSLLSTISVRTAKLISAVMILGIIGVGIYAALLFGKPTRDVGLLEDIHAIQSMVPNSNTVALSDQFMASSGMHMYLQRYLELELVDQDDNAKLAIWRNPVSAEQDSILQSLGFAPAYSGKKLTLYIRGKSIPE